MKICQVLLCQFSHHVIRLMKNLRQMRNTFLINSFRHKFKISENHQNNSHQDSDTDNCHELFSPDRLLSIRIMIFNIHSFRSFLRTLLRMSSLCQCAQTQIPRLKKFIFNLLTSESCNLPALQEWHSHLKHILSRCFSQWYLLHQTPYSHLSDKPPCVLVSRDRLP